MPPLNQYRTLFDRWPEIVATYIGVPAFLALWWGYRAVKKSRLIDYEDMPFKFPPEVDAQKERRAA